MYLGNTNGEKQRWMSFAVICENKTSEKVRRAIKNCWFGVMPGDGRLLVVRLESRQWPFSLPLEENESRWRPTSRWALHV